MLLTESHFQISNDSIQQKFYALTNSPTIPTSNEKKELCNSIANMDFLSQISWIIKVVPVSRNDDSCQVTKINLHSGSQTFIPRTALGKKLMLLRQRAIASGMKLFDEDEVLEETKRRRGELGSDDTNIH